MNLLRKINLNNLKKIANNRLFRIFLLLLIAFLMLVLWFNAKIFIHFTKFGYLGIFLSNFLSSATVLVPLPGIATVYVGGSYWNPTLSGLVGGTGAAVGELIGYLSGYGSIGILNSFQSKTWYKHLERFFNKNGFITILLISAIPFPFFDAVGILAGTLNYPIWKFFIATLIGRIVRDIFIAWFGELTLPM